jgi:hypothetical protein
MWFSVLKKPGRVFLQSAPLVGVQKHFDNLVIVSGMQGSGANNPLRADTGHGNCVSWRKSMPVALSVLVPTIMPLLSIQK